jgi:hypothetical protein
MNAVKRIALVMIAAVLLAVAAAPALAAEDASTLTIQNKTGSNVSLILRGPTDLDLDIVRLTTKVRLDWGTYSYRYEACGLRRNGTFTIGYGGATLILKKCEKAPNGSIIIDNRIGQTFVLILLNSEKRYVLTIKPGDNRVSVLAGRYQYSAYVCGSIQSGEKSIKSKNNADWVWSCSK